MLFASAVEVTHRALATPDLIIIGVYFAIVFGIGMYFARKERTSEDYFLAGRDIGWFFIGASLFVSNISTEHFIGLSGTGASSGLAVGHFEWLACLILLILGWVFVPFYLRSNVFTMPEFLERRFNRQCAVYLAGISIIAYIFTKISVQLYAASVVLERVAGWSLWKTAIILVIATGIYIFAGFLKILPVFMLVLPGIIAYALYPDQVAKPDFAYPTLVLNLLPVGLVGLVMAALLAAVMGAMSSVFNSASTLVTLDFYKKLRPQASEKQLVNFGRIATGIMVLLGLLWVPFIHYISSQLYIYLQSVQAYISPPISACFVLGILWPRLNGSGAIASLLTGFVMGATRFVLEIADRASGGRFDSSAVRWLIDMNFLHYAIFMFIVCALVLIAVSLMTPAPDRKRLAGLTFATVDDKMETVAVGIPVRKPAHETPTERAINIVFSLVLLATVVGLWIYFR